MDLAFVVVALEHDVVFVVIVAVEDGFVVVAEDDFVVVGVADEVVLEVGEDGMGGVVEVSLNFY